MKKSINIYISLIAVLILFNSCSDFLDEEPISTLGVDDFYSTTTEADLAIAGIYSNLAQDETYGQALSIIMASGTDEGVYNRDQNNNWSVGLYTHTSSDVYVKNLWTELYTTINLSNLFIEKLQKDQFTDEEYNMYIGEAKFLRAYCYFILTSWYEEVPMSLTATQNQNDNNKAAASLEVIYNQIIEDFTAAADGLPLANAELSPERSGRANKMASYGMLARVYLKMAGYPYNQTQNHDADAYYLLAKTNADIVLSSSHTLNLGTTDDGYREHFLNYITNNYDTQESLFEISFKYLRDQGIRTDGRIGGLNGLSFNYGGTLGYPSAYAMENATPLLAGLYDASDSRKEWNLPAIQYTTSGNISRVNTKLDQQYCPGKYRRWEPIDEADLDIDGENQSYLLLEDNATPNKNFTTVNFPILRYSDVLLMYAEAENALNGPTNAIPKLNEVRARAGLTSFSVGDAPVATKNLFFDELVDERARELCFEGQRKQDLIRWELLEERLAISNQLIQGDPDYDATNSKHVALLRAGENFDVTKHMSLPYPDQEVYINNLLDQKDNWK